MLSKVSLALNCVKWLIIENQCIDKNQDAAKSLKSAKKGFEKFPLGASFHIIVRNEVFQNSYLITLFYHLSY